MSKFEEEKMKHEESMGKKMKKGPTFYGYHVPVCLFEPVAKLTIQKNHVKSSFLEYNAENRLSNYFKFINLCI